MVAITPGVSATSLDEVVDSLELALEAIDDLRAQIDGLSSTAAEPPPIDERPDRLLAEVDRLRRRVEEIGEAAWRRSEDDRLQGALDAIDRLRIRVDDADPSEAVLRTLDMVSEVAARLDVDDARALAELTLEAVEDLCRQTGADGSATRAVLDRSVAELARLRLDVEARDPTEGIELALEAMDDVGGRVDARADAIERRLAAMESSLAVLTELAGTLAAMVAELATSRPQPVAAPSLDDAAVAAIAVRVAGALMGRSEQLAGRVEPMTAALPSGEQHASVIASAAAAMSRLEGRLDGDFGSVERSVDRLDRHLAELEGLLREERTNGHSPGPPRLRWRGRAARR